MNNNQHTLIEKAAAIISKATKIVAFTGAGISAESGIPPFRGENGIWNKYDPDSLDIDYYYRNTKESWKVIKEIFFDFFNNNEIKPNPGHEVLAKWAVGASLNLIIPFVVSTVKAVVSTPFTVTIGIKSVSMFLASK